MPKIETSSPTDNGRILMPPGWMVPVRGMETKPVRVDTRARTKPLEAPHYSDYFTLSMKKEEDLGVVPPAWSTSAAMKDVRPNGKAQFDARHLNNAVGRMRGGRSAVWDPRGTMAAGETQTIPNIDIAFYQANKYKDLVAKGIESAEFAEYYDGVNTLGDDGANAQKDLMIAQMSAFQKAKMDKDGDGSLSIAEMEAQGFAFGMHNKSGSDGIISNVHGDVNSDATYVDLAQRGGANAIM